MVTVILGFGLNYRNMRSNEIKKVTFYLFFFCLKNTCTYLIQFRLRIPIVCLVLVYDVQNCQKFAIETYDVMTLHTQWSHLVVENGLIDLKSAV